MTSITWAGPTCVQEAAAILGPQNRTQGRCVVFFAFFINISNRLLTIGIVAYRYVFVLKSWLVATPAQRRVFSSLILLFILLPSLLLTGVAVHYRDYWLRFLSRTTTSQGRLPC